MLLASCGLANPSLKSDPGRAPPYDPFRISDACRLTHCEPGETLVHLVVSMRTSGGEGSGSRRERDIDTDSEKDARLSERESTDSRLGFHDGAQPSTTAVASEPFLGRPQQYRHGRMTASGHTSADSLRLPAGAGAKANLEDAVGWQDLPRKKQLVVITLARLSEPLVQTSLQSYMYYQLKWFDSTLPDSVISSQAGVLTASFTAAQFLTAMLWGRVADSTRFGRKTVLMIGLGGTMLSCLGFGFSTTFWQALFFRSLGGITNGNVGVMRTMISEIVREKKYQSRAFLLLPMTFNIGVIIGPVLGGILSDPAGSYPTVFGRVKFFRDFPYAAPNILSTFFLLCATLSVWLNLEETLDARRDKRDIGLEFGNKLSGALGTLYGCRMHPVDYTPLASRDASVPIEMASTSTSRRSAPDTYTQPDRARQAVRRRYTRRLPFRRIFTRNVSCTLVAHFLLAFHVGTFNSLWFVFLSTPVYDADKATESSHALQRKPPFFFTGGLGLQPREVGMAMAILGVLGISLQLLVYPKLSARLGTLRSWRLFLMCFPFTYFLVPYLSLVPSTSPPPHPKDGIGVWASIAGVLLFQVVGRTFALPAQTILVNNCTPHPSVLGTVHGLGQSVSSFARTIGPMLCGFLYGLGLAKGIVGAVWWGLSGVAVCGVLASWWVREGDGHEIRLDGDDDGDS